ncbi:ATP-binding protein [Streptomyces puniciscabiei]|uniref:ATP-binding protein n=1 Tax=Streptomyces puniciscabiei TaxID=164348 RepID=UPI0033295984
MNPQISTPAPEATELVQRLSATPLGARLARRLTSTQLATWGYPHDSDPNCTAQLIVAELAANAVTHGRLPGRDFELRLRLLPERDTLRIEVSDARGDKELRFLDGRPEDENGRGLVVVLVLSSRWGVTQRTVGKTVWAELPLSPRQRSRRPHPGTPRPCARTPAPEG